MELAVFADCLKLIEEFVRNGDPSFDSFCKEWKNMSFQHIFSAQTSNIEICQTTTAIMHVAKRTACGYSTTGEPMQLHGDSPIERSAYRLRRLGALYLMYAVYLKQPTQNYIKAEITLKAWRELRDFVKNYSTDVKQARFLFWKLTKAGAFRFTTSDFYVAVDNLVNYDNIERHDQHSANLKTDLVRELSAIHTIQTTLPSLLAMEQRYNNVKKQLTDNNEGLNAKALPSLNICENIQNVFKRIDNILKGTAEINNKTNNGENSDVVFNTRRAIKRRAYEGNCSVNEELSQDEETADGDEDDDNDDDDFDIISQRKNINVSRRISALNIFSEELPEELLKDLHNDNEATSEQLNENSNAATSNKSELPNLDIDNENSITTSNDSHEILNVSTKILDIDSF